MNGACIVNSGSTIGWPASSSSENSRTKGGKFLSLNLLVAIPPAIFAFNAVTGVS